MDKGFPGGSVVENPLANEGDAKDVGLIPWVGKIPWRRKWQPIPVFLLGKFHGQRSLAGYSPWGHKESDMTEPLSLSQDSLSLHINKSRKNHFVSHLPFHPKLHVFPTLLLAWGLPSPQHPPIWLPPQQLFISAGGRALQRGW